MRKLTGVVGAALLVGCSNPVYVGDRTWAAGWREGTVEVVRSQARWRAGCGKPIKAEDQVAVVHYRSMGKPRWIEISAEGNLMPPPGVKVLFNLNTCELVRL